MKTHNTQNSVYELNKNNVNRWSAHVQPGQNDKGQRTSDEEIEIITNRISYLLNKYGLED